MTTEPSDGRVASSSMPDFVQFYRAINQRSPFPWQRRLAEMVAMSGRWPMEIGVPTGLGKTACLDIAVWWLASQTHLPPAKRSAPTRIWWVVNRRLLVDSTAEHACLIANMLREPASAERKNHERSVIAAVALRLRALAAGPRAAPLEVIRLRGGIASRTPRDPSQPAIVLCTLPMYGSRVLFRGYGSIQKMRVVDAAMAGTDSLVLLDEAHLAPHLNTLLDALDECYPKTVSIPNADRSKPRVAALTATGDASDKERFTLDDDDASNSVVQARLNAAKPLELRRPTGDSAKALADATLEIIRGLHAPVACLVFANTPKTARKTWKRIEKQMPGSKAEVLLLTGLTREREAEQIRSRILHPDHGMAAVRDTDDSRQRHFIVVSTQTLEVGADIDAEYLITEACGVRALIQRLGRLNRMGRFAHARAIYVHLPPPKRPRRDQTGNPEIWPIYGTEPAHVLNRLEHACHNSIDGTVDLSPAHVTRILGAPSDSPGRAPEMLPGILWEWIKTSKAPAGEAPVEPYFSGIDGAQYKVSLIWRAYVPKPGEQLWPRATDREAVDVPINEVRDAIKVRELELCRLKPDGKTVESISDEELVPGNQIVLPTDCGLLDEFGWNPDASDPVLDVSLFRRGLPLDAKCIERLCGLALKAPIETVLSIIKEEEDVDPREQADALKDILKAIQAAPTPTGWKREEWMSFSASLNSAPLVRPHNAVPRLAIEDHDADRPAGGAAIEELDQHCKEVGSRARAVAICVGLPPCLADIVEHAGRLHDIGKAERRFQRWVDPDGQRSVPVANSNTPPHLWELARAASGWPRGGRHEALSARLVQAWLNQSPTWGDAIKRGLLVHLVICHHGQGRPLVRPVADDTACTVSAVVIGVPLTVQANVGIVDWDQPTRFRMLNDHFGPWVLALLESIVIRSDHAISGGRHAETGG